MLDTPGRLRPNVLPKRGRGEETMDESVATDTLTVTYESQKTYLFANFFSNQTFVIVHIHKYQNFIQETLDRNVH